jgi:hypothetical protein
MAALLREQLTDQYEIVNLQNWMREKGIDADSLIQRVGAMVEALRHLATQA